MFSMKNIRKRASLAIEAFDQTSPSVKPFVSRVTSCASN